jgi:hypothetical protein
LISRFGHVLSFFLRHLRKLTCYPNMLIIIQDYVIYVKHFVWLIYYSMK